MCRRAGDAGFDNLDPQMRSIAMMIERDSGGRVCVGSGWRSIQQQSSMYNAWRSGNYNVPRVAPPGKSKHNHGLAIDFEGDLQLAQQLGRKYGLIFPMGDEPWHGQLGGRRSENAAWTNGQPVQYSLNYTDPLNQGNPEDVLANRMHAMMRILGQDESLIGTSMAPDMSMVESPDTSQVAAPTESMSQLPEAGARQITTQLGGMTPSGKPIAGGGGVPDPKGFGAYARSLFQRYGWSDADYRALVRLWNKESGDPRAGDSRVTWSNTAQNPSSTAFGIAQFLNGTWSGTGINKTVDPRQQIQAGLMYISKRFGNPRNALNFHLANNWY